MAIEKTEGLLIRAADFSDSSRVVTFFTRDFGKLGALAKGGRRLKSSFDAALDLLSVCSICVIRKTSGALDLLTEAMLVERFDGLRLNLKRLYAAYYIAEILDGLMQLGEPHQRLYEGTVVALRTLAEVDDPRLTLGSYVLLLLTELGYAPQLEHCVGCGGAAKLSTATPYSVLSGGVLCGTCAQTGGPRIAVRGGAIAALRILAADNRRAARLSVNETDKKEIWRLTGQHVQALLGRMPKTASLLQL